MRGAQQTGPRLTNANAWQKRLRDRDEIGVDGVEMGVDGRGGRDGVGEKMERDCWLEVRETGVGWVVCVFGYVSRVGQSRVSIEKVWVMGVRLSVKMGGGVGVGCTGAWEQRRLRHRARQNGEWVGRGIGMGVG